MNTTQSALLAVIFEAVLGWLCNSSQEWANAQAVLCNLTLGCVRGIIGTATLQRLERSTIQGSVFLLLCLSC